MRIHLDTDLGGDTDDACALAMLLGWPGVERVGIITTTESGGRRAGYVAHCLQLAGRDNIPVAAGAEVSLTTLRSAGVVTDDERHWPTTIAPRPSPARPWWRSGPTPTSRCWRSLGPAAPRPRPRGGDGGMDGAARRRPACLGAGDGP